MRRALMAAAGALALALTACTGGEDADPTATETSSTASTATDEGAGLPSMPITEADAGPRPLLSWPAVDGAAQYHVTVFAADGSAYWSWSGAETEVYVGGVDDPDGAGAFVFEPMTWRVMAEAEDGTVLGLSEASALTP